MAFFHPYLALEMPMKKCGKAKNMNIRIYSDKYVLKTGMGTFTYIFASKHLSYLHKLMFLFSIHYKQKMKNLKINNILLPI